MRDHSKVCKSQKGCRSYRERLAGRRMIRRSAWPSGSRVRRRKAHGRRVVERPSKVVCKTPKGRKPKGVAGSMRAKPPISGNGLSRGEKPRGRSSTRRYGACFVAGCGSNGAWVLLGRKVGLPCGRGKLRRVNPKSAARLKHGGRGFGGRKPPRGRSNPEGGTWRVGISARSGPPIPDVL
jgi:hypothetical protein